MRLLCPLLGLDVGFGETDRRLTTQHGTTRMATSTVCISIGLHTKVIESLKGSRIVSGAISLSTP